MGHAEHSFAVLDSVAPKDETHRSAGEDKWRALRQQRLGRLANGLTHELGTPLQFVGDSVSFIEQVNGDLQKALAASEQMLGLCAVDTATSMGLEATLKMIKESRRALDSEAPRALRRATEGIGQVVSLIRAVRTFSNPRSTPPERLTAMLDRLLVLLKNEYKYVAEVQFVEIPEPAALAPDLDLLLFDLVVLIASGLRASVSDAPFEKVRIRIGATWLDDLLTVTINRSRGPDLTKTKASELSLVRALLDERRGALDVCPATFVVRIPPFVRVIEDSNPLIG
ncbi:MAG: hypothetical protein HY791_25150 [Deltaproteobacteria bacterium]|nr:hypothetical protein [Deltaproteobacteria bacterium]